MAIAGLPRIMVAPNGARRTKSDHPALPVTIEEIVTDALACHEAGAGGLHAHVRDSDGKHVLDAQLYCELIDAMAQNCPGMLVQITTEAVGRYTPQQQRDLVRAVRPRAVSVALGEMMSGGIEAGSAFYRRAHDEEIAVQHILYEPEEVDRLAGLVEDRAIPSGELQVLFVLGRYTAGQASDPAMLDGFLTRLVASSIDADWAVCAFGVNETACLRHALKQGGKIRIGFENSLWRSDGSLAKNNAERVAEIVGTA